MSNSNPKVRIDSNAIIVELPLTTPTGKVRVKRRINNFGLPVATRSTPFQKNDYVEWQISYGTKDGNDVLDFIKFSDGKVGFELAKIICYAKQLGILTQEDFEELLDFVESVEKTIEESETLVRRPTDKEVYGFKRFEEIVPVFIKSGRGYFVEIALKHKQKAIGYQSMVYLCVWVKNLEDSKGSSLIGRKAEAKEFARFKITDENKEIIKDVVRAFAIASKQHNEDMKILLEKVMERC